MSKPPSSRSLSKRVQPGARAALSAALALAGCGTASPGRHASTAQPLTVSAPVEVEPGVSVPAATTTTLVRAAFNGTVHLAAWVDASGVVMMTRVSAAGVVLDPLGIALGPSVTASLARDAPSVASDGTSFLVAWTARAGEVRAARVDG
ncbi:MAG: hypothetical protein JWM10_228, partial [Myxococcaceae bacterium]|nr:hypothetical protein [Myxococcaceae bacterium]